MATVDSNVHMQLVRSRLANGLYSLEMHGGNADDFARESKMFGELMKRSGSLWKSWQQRFVVMKPTLLVYYFQTKQDTFPRGVLMLDENSTTERAPALDGQEHVLAIRSNPRDPHAPTLHLATESERQAQQWQEALGFWRADVLAIARESAAQQAAKLRAELIDANARAQRYQDELKAITKGVGSQLERYASTMEIGKLKLDAIRLSLSKYLPLVVQAMHVLYALASPKAFIGSRGRSRDRQHLSDERNRSDSIRSVVDFTKLLEGNDMEEMSPPPCLRIPVQLLNNDQNELLRVMEHLDTYPEQTRRRASLAHIAFEAAGTICGDNTRSSTPDAASRSRSTTTRVASTRDAKTKSDDKMNANYNGTTTSSYEAPERITSSQVQPLKNKQYQPRVQTAEGKALLHLNFNANATADAVALSGTQALELARSLGECAEYVVQASNYMRTSQIDKIDIMRQHLHMLAHAARKYRERSAVAERSAAEAHKHVRDTEERMARLKRATRDAILSTRRQVKQQIAVATAALTEAMETAAASRQTSQTQTVDSALSAGDTQRVDTSVSAEDNSSKETDDTTKSTDETHQDTHPTTISTNNTEVVSATSKALSALQEFEKSLSNSTSPTATLDSASNGMQMSDAVGIQASGYTPKTHVDSESNINDANPWHATNLSVQTGHRTSLPPPPPPTPISHFKKQLDASLLYVLPVGAVQLPVNAFGRGQCHAYVKMSALLDLPDHSSSGRWSRNAIGMNHHGGSDMMNFTSATVSTSPTLCTTNNNGMGLTCSFQQPKVLALGDAPRPGDDPNRALVPYVRIDVCARRTLAKDVLIGSAIVSTNALRDWPYQPHAVWLSLRDLEPPTSSGKGIRASISGAIPSKAKPVISVRPLESEVLIPVRRGGVPLKDFAEQDCMSDSDSEECEKDETSSRFALPTLPPPPVAVSPAILVQFVWCRHSAHPRTGIPIRPCFFGNHSPQRRSSTNSLGTRKGSETKLVNPSSSAHQTTINAISSATSNTGTSLTTPIHQDHELTSSVEGPYGHSHTSSVTSAPVSRNTEPHRRVSSAGNNDAESTVSAASTPMDRQLHTLAKAYRRLRKDHISAQTELDAAKLEIARLREQLQSSSVN